jgi:hypothetical protein
VAEYRRRTRLGHQIRNRRTWTVTDTHRDGSLTVVDPDRGTVDVVGVVDLQVVHPVVLGRVHDLLEPVGADLSTERDGQDDLGIRVRQVATWPPQVGESSRPPERDLALRRAHVERAERFQTAMNLLVDRLGEWVPVEGSRWMHATSVAHRVAGAPSLPSSMNASVRRWNRARGRSFAQPTASVRIYASTSSSNGAPVEHWNWLRRAASPAAASKGRRFTKRR